MAGSHVPPLQLSHGDTGPDHRGQGTTARHTGENRDDGCNFYFGCPCDYPYRAKVIANELSRNDAIEMGSATVPVAPVGVSSTGLGLTCSAPNGVSARRREVFGGTPKTAGGTPRAPKRTASFRLRYAEDARLKWKPNQTRCRENTTNQFLSTLFLSIAF